MHCRLLLVAEVVVVAQAASNADESTSEEHNADAFNEMGWDALYMFSHKCCSSPVRARVATSVHANGSS